MFDRVIKSVTRQVTTFRDILPHCCLPTSETRRLRGTRNARIDERLRSSRSLSSPSPSPTIRTSSGGGGGGGGRIREREDGKTFRLLNFRYSARRDFLLAGSSNTGHMLSTFLATYATPLPVSERDGASPRVAVHSHVTTNPITRVAYVAPRGSEVR